MAQGREVDATPITTSAASRWTNGTVGVLGCGVLGLGLGGAGLGELQSGHVAVGLVALLAGLVLLAGVVLSIRFVRAAIVLEPQQMHVRGVIRSATIPRQGVIAWTYAPSWVELATFGTVEVPALVWRDDEGREHTTVLMALAKDLQGAIGWRREARHTARSRRRVRGWADVPWLDLED